ncbi:hypothetical protein CkaCkLH20_10906 [Colletotrichum karsti]|uniref:Uncharacterized protein n=1 Tax=Colletotrichum karsti TaxID=1095194 RepID=A0A9P6LFQ4_9PEZI|nr:uncharacterized protein CkaCkLH20_10906 [Colletotrichum karsti]KAF9871708.1 hypothetical protein CkaCkLH20_10906 [Colletotrichum karsti]
MAPSSLSSGYSSFETLEPLDLIQGGQSFVVVHNFDPNLHLQPQARNLRPWLKVAAGEVGYHYKLDGGKVCMVKIHRGTEVLPGKCSALPKSYLKFGALCRPGTDWETKFDDDELESSQSGDAGSSPPQEELRQTIQSLWKTALENKKGVVEDTGTGPQAEGQFPGQEVKLHADGTWRSDLWLMWYDYRKDKFIYHARRALRPSGNGILLVSNNDTSRVEIQMTVNELTVPESPELINVVIEVNRNKKTGEYAPHPAAYYSLPTVLRNKEYQKLNSLAIKIDRRNKQTGKWDSAYLQRAKLWTQDSEAHLDMVKQGMVLFNNLEQAVYSNGPDWLPKLDGTRVMEVESVHLFQEYRVRRLPTVVSTWPQDFTVDECSQ